MQLLCSLQLLDSEWMIYIKEHMAAFSAGMRALWPWPLQMTPGIFLFEVQPSPPAPRYSVKHVSYSQRGTATVDTFECEDVNMI